MGCADGIEAVLLEGVCRTELQNFFFSSPKRKNNMCFDTSLGPGSINSVTEMGILFWVPLWITQQSVECFEKTATHKLSDQQHRNTFMMQLHATQHNNHVINLTLIMIFFFFFLLTTTLVCILTVYLSGCIDCSLLKCISNRHYIYTSNTACIAAKHEKWF